MTRQNLPRLAHARRLKPPAPRKPPRRKPSSRTLKTDGPLASGPSLFSAISHRLFLARWNLQQLGNLFLRERLLEELQLHGVGNGTIEIGKFVRLQGFLWLEFIHGLLEDID